MVLSVPIFQYLVYLHMKFRNKLCVFVDALSVYVYEDLIKGDESVSELAPCS